MLFRNALRFRHLHNSLTKCREKTQTKPDAVGKSQHNSCRFFPVFSRFTCTRALFCSEYPPPFCEKLVQFLWRTRESEGPEAPKAAPNPPAPVAPKPTGALPEVNAAAAAANPLDAPEDPNPNPSDGFAYSAPRVLLPRTSCPR